MLICKRNELWGWSQESMHLGFALKMLSNVREGLSVSM